MLGFFIAVLSGALMSIQGVFNAETTKQSGIWTAAGFVQLSAFVVCFFAWLITGRENGASALLEVKPRFYLLAGLMGAAITFTVIKSVQMLGPAKSVMFIVTAQLLVAYIIEIFGLFGTEKVSFSFRKLCAVAVTAAGIIWFKMDSTK